MCWNCAFAASPQMDFGSLPVDILRLILPSHGKPACIAARVCSSWRTHIQSQLLQPEGNDRSLPNWCHRWQVADLSEANCAFGTLCRMHPHLLRFADVYNSSGELLSDPDASQLGIFNHVQLGQAMDPKLFQFFTAQSIAGDSSCWNNLALMERCFGDDLDRMESWWLCVEARLNTKQHGAPILQSLRFGSTWQHLYNHASRLSPEVTLTRFFSALQHDAFYILISYFQACFLYLFHNGQSKASDNPGADRGAFCQSQPWRRSLVRSIPDARATLACTHSRP